MYVIRRRYIRLPASLRRMSISRQRKTFIHIYIIKVIQQNNGVADRRPSCNVRYDLHAKYVRKICTQRTEI